MDLLEIKQKYEKLPHAHSILLYGRAFSGKTYAAAQLALLPEITKITWLDLNNGLDTILNMGLPDEALKKIEIIQLADSRINPTMMKQLMQMLSSRDGFVINGVKFCIPKMTFSELLVIDSLSDIASAAINQVMKDSPLEVSKLSSPKWGEVNGFLLPLFQIIQHTKNTFILCLAHTLEKEKEDPFIKDKTYTEIIPQCGTEPFSRKVGTFFGTVIYMTNEGGNFKMGCGSKYKRHVLTGSRLAIEVEKEKGGLLTLIKRLIKS